MIQFAPVLCAYAGMAALCVAMTKHQRETLGRTLSAGEQRRLKIGGAASLAAAYLCASVAFGWNIGPVAFVGAAIVGGLAVALVLPHRPRWTPPTAVGAIAVAAVLTAGILIP